LGDTLEDILKHDRRGQLSSLRPVSAGAVAAISEQVPSISQQYLAFLERIGVGSTTLEMHIYPPQPMAGLTGHQSAMLYGSANARALFGNGAAQPAIPDDAVAIADSGASWRYCLCPSLSEEVFVFDMAGQTFDKEAPDFFSFVRDTLLLDSEHP